MANFYTCDPDQLKILSVCFLEPATGEQERRGIELHARVHELAAIGGASYIGNIAALLTAAGKWRKLSCRDREAIGCYRTVQDAIGNGASFATGISALKKGSACYKAIGSEDQKNALAFLSCSIGAMNFSSGED
jgi:hypothetical protein